LVKRGAIGRRIGNPAIDFSFAPASAVDADPQLRRERPFGDFPIDGRAGQAGPVEDGFEADDTVWFGHVRRLRRFIEEADASGLQPAVVAKVQRIVSFLQDMEQEEELRTVPSWKAHMLTGDRKGTWSLFVTLNWRMTFRIDREEIEIIDLDYEDYH